jgi:hypothetical protein
VDDVVQEILGGRTQMVVMRDILSTIFLSIAHLLMMDEQLILWPTETGKWRVVGVTS